MHEFASTVLFTVIFFIVLGLCAVGSFFMNQWDEEE